MANERNIDVRVRLKGADQFKREMGGVSDSLGWLDVTKGILGSQIIQKGFQMIANAINSSIDESVKFESAMASLRKTAGLSETGMANMAKQIMDMSERVPMAATDIANLADTVAHLGLSEKDILPFTETMIALGVATDMSAEQAATALAQLANVMHTSNEDYERLGSTIFALGRTSATTESHITDMAQSMAGSAALLGMSEANALGFSAALSSVGVESAQGASMLQKLGTKIELMVGTGSAKLEDFARVADMSAQEFSESWRADPARTLAAFITGVGKIEDQGGSAIQTLNGLGISEIRLLRTTSSLAAAGDLLDRSLDTADKAWKENTELANATGIAYGTTASKLQMAENAITNAKIAVGDNFAGAKLAVKELEADAAKVLRDTITDDSLGKQMYDISKRYEDIGHSLSTTHEQALVLIDSLEELGDPATLNADELQQYEAIMSALNGIMPGIADGYDSVTRSLEGGTKGLKDYADQQYNIAHSANEVNRASEALEAYSAKEEAYNELLIKQAEAYARMKAAETDYNEYKNSDAVKTWGVDETSDQFINYEKARIDYGNISKDVNDARKYLDQYAYAADDAAKASDDLNIAMNGVGSMAETVDNQFAQMERSLQLYSSEADVILQDFSDALEQAQKDIDKLHIGDLGKNYGDHLRPNEFDPAGSTLNSLETQIKYMEDYMEKLGKLKELGYSDDVIAQLSDGSTDSYKILKGLTDDSALEHIDEINAAYESVQTQKEAMATAMADAASSATSRMSEIEDAVQKMAEAADQSTTAQSGMSSTMQGLINGIDGKIGTLRTKVSEVERLTKKVANADTGGSDGSHAAGLTYVPYDGYLAQLHRGERVLTALEAKAYRQEQLTSSRISAASRGGTDNRRYNTMNSNTTVKFGDVYVRNEADIEDLSNKLATLNRRKHRGVGVIG